MKEYAIVGGGIGGCSTAALLHHYGHDVTLIEKEPYLGGCASTFTHGGNRYNTGATTISGYQENGILKKLFDTLGLIPDLIETDPGIVIVQKGKSIPRYADVASFVHELQTLHPHPKHAEFWDLIRYINDSFYSMQGYYYSNASLLKKMVSLCSFLPMLGRFVPYVWRDARTFIDTFYGSITQSYRDFLDAQIRIVAQETSENVNFFTAALALGYTFNPTHYPVGGMGHLCDQIISRVPDVRRSTEVLGIERIKDRYILTTNKGRIEAKNLIMGTSHYGNADYFNNPKIRNYYKHYEKLNNHQSAFVLYMSVSTTKHFQHHYQLIADETVPDTISKALFVSISDPSDRILSPSGYYSITASIHTDERYWEDPQRYREQKKALHDLLRNWICDTLAIESSEIIDSFAATPKTFGRYIHRTQLGGNAMSITNLLPRLPSNDTPIEGLYHVGDTSYAAQGWPGVVMGAFNLCRLIHG